MIINQKIYKKWLFSKKNISLNIKKKNGKKVIRKKKFVIVVKLQIDFKPSREHTYKNS